MLTLIFSLVIPLDDNYNLSKKGIIFIFKPNRFIPNKCLWYSLNNVEFVWPARYKYIFVLIYILNILSSSIQCRYI